MRPSSLDGGHLARLRLINLALPRKEDTVRVKLGEWVYLHLFLFTPCVCFYSNLICLDLPPVFVLESTFASTASSKWLLTDLEFVLHHSPQPSFVSRKQEQVQSYSINGKLLQTFYFLGFGSHTSVL